MPITHDFGDNAIIVKYVDGDAKGDSFENPYTFDDIYDYAVANGLDILKFGNEMYNCKVQLSLQNSNTYVVFRNVIIDFYGLPDKAYGLYVTCNFKVNTISTDFSLLYCSNIQTSGYRWKISMNSPNAEFKNVVIKNLYFFMVYSHFSMIDCTLMSLSNGMSIYNTAQFSANGCKYIGGTYTYIMYSIPVSFENNSTKYMSMNMLLGYTSDEITVKKYMPLNSTYDVTIGPLSSGIGGITNFVDSQIDTAKIYVMNRNWTTNHRLNLKSTFNIYTLPNSIIKLTDKDGNVLISKETNGSGELTEEVTYFSKYAAYLEGVGITENTDTISEPFKLVVSKWGYETEAIENITVTPGIPTTLNVTLKKAIEVVATNIGPAIKVNKENYGRDREIALFT